MISDDTTPQVIVLQEVAEERESQDAVFGEQNHDPFIYLSILGEEVGEAHQAAVDAYFHGEPWDDYRGELLHVAAVAVAMIEAFDRRHGNMPINGWLYSGRADEQR